MKLNELQEKRAHIAEQLMEIATGDMTPEQRTKYDSLNKEANDLRGDIERIENAEKLNAELSQRNRPPRGPVGTDDAESEKRDLKLREDRTKAAFGHFLRTGQIVGDFLKRDVEGMSELPRELRDLGLATATSSLAPAVFVPADFVNKIEQAMLAYGNLIPAVTTLPTSTGAPLPFPTSNDTSELAEILAEGVTVGTGDPGLSSVILGAFKYSTKLIPVSLELAQDSAFPMDSYLAGIFGIRLARKLTRDITIGAGTTEPKGLITAATAGPTATGSATNDGSAATGANSIGTDDISDLIHAVDPDYRLNAKFVMHDSTVQALEKVKDKYGRPVFIPNPQTGRLESLFGYPIVISQYMATIATTNKTVLFGDLSKYVLRKVRELSILRLVERYADKGQIAFIGFARYDGNLLDAGTHPVKYLVQA